MLSWKLRAVEEKVFLPKIVGMLVDGEEIIGAYQSLRKGVLFTSKRIIVIRSHGFTGQKAQFTSLPYHHIQAYAVETAGSLDLDKELILWLSGHRKIRLKFATKTKVAYICRIISENSL